MQANVEPDSNVNYMLELSLLEIDEVDDSELVDFVRWLHYNYREKCDAYWWRFRDYVARGRG